MDNQYAIDIETDGLLRSEPGRERIATKVHCICLTDLSTRQTLRHHNEPTLNADGAIDDALALMDSADLLVGHNLIDFDLPALSMLEAWAPSDGTTIRDTLVTARLQFPWIKQMDFRDKTMPAKLRGSHNLASWGWRLGKRKGDFADKADENPDLWATLTQEMLDYCALDTELCALLWRTLNKRGWPPRSMDLEHRFAVGISGLMHAGVGFDLPAAVRLEADLKARMEAGREKLSAALGTVTKTWVTPVRKQQRSKTVPVNPGSAQQVADALERLYGWRPEKFTPTGLAQMDESVISEMDESVVPKELKVLLLDGAIVQKALGQLSTGRTPWIKVAQAVDTPSPHHRVFYYVNHNGAWTGRCTHRTVVNVPRVTTPLGTELRSLFVPAPGWTLVGGDIKSGEACILGHLLVPYDGGAFRDRIVSGEDVHTENWKRCGDLIPSRQEAKNVLYACAYGAYPRKVGKMLGIGPVKGGEVRRAILNAVPGLERLFEDMQTRASESGFLIGLDGRKLRPRAAYAGLNTAVQGALGVVMKLATVLAVEKLAPMGARLVLHYHDEYQFEVPPTVDTQEVQAAMTWAIEEAARRVGIKCPMTGDTKAGKSWAETH